MEEFEKRIIVEKEELGKKIVKLSSFLFVENDMKTALSIDTVNLMYSQLYAMIEYHKVLRKRLPLNM